MYEFTDQELRDLIWSLPPVFHAKLHPPIRVKLLGVKELLRKPRKCYRKFRSQANNQ